MFHTEIPILVRRVVFLVGARQGTSPQSAFQAFQLRGHGSISVKEAVSNELLAEEGLLAADPSLLTVHSRCLSGLTCLQGETLTSDPLPVNVRS